jgi:hypothetical protein
MGERMMAQIFVVLKQEVVAVESAVVAAELVEDRMVVLDPVAFVGLVQEVEDNWNSLEKNRFVVELCL